EFPGKFRYAAALAVVPRCTKNVTNCARRHARSAWLVGGAVRAEQGGVATHGGGIDGSGPFVTERQQVMRPARLWPGAGKAETAEGLGAHHGADDGAV